MLDVVMLCVNDWANTGWRFAQCLKMKGLSVLALKGYPHPFLYPEQMLVHPALTETGDGAGAIHTEARALGPIANAARVVHFRDTCFVNTGVNLEEKKVVAQHGGRVYRLKSDKWNTAMSGYIDKTIIQMPDLLGLGAKNEHLIYYPVQTDVLQPVYKRYDQKKLIFGHFPTHQINKGSDLFVGALQRNWDAGRRNFLFTGKQDFDRERNYVKVSYWMSHLYRVSQLDVMMETCSMTAQGKPYGEWGNQCIEAAALGKIVITNTLSADLYKKEYGEGFAPRIANNEDEIAAHVEELLGMTDKEILDEKQRSRAWVEKYHSMEATSDRLWDKIYRGLLDGA